MRKNFSGRNKKIILAGLFIGLIFLFFNSHFCFAEVAPGQDSNLIGSPEAQGGFFDSINPFVWAQKIMATVLYKLVQASSWILAAAMWFLNIMVSADFYNNVLLSDKAIEAINAGWMVVRDFLNLFFILMLLLIAIGTILRVPAYGDKKLVFGVVLAALLINFSKAFALLIIDISQMFMNFFMGALNFGGTKTFADQILYNVQAQDAFQGELEAKGGDYTGLIVMCVASIIFFLVMAVMLFVLAATLLVRVVAFWILIILSPVAMFGFALPRTGLGALQKKWMENMMHWAFFGPIQLFFLWLALVILTKVTGYPALSGKDGGTLFQTLPSASADNRIIILKFFGIIIPYVSAIYMLFYGYDMAKKYSTGAATTIMNWGSQKMAQAGKKWGKSAAIGTAFMAMPAAAIAGAGAYYGGRGLGRLTGDYFEGKRQKWADKKGMGAIRTKEEAKKKREEQKEERIANAKGGEEAKKYWRGRTNKQKKEWEDLGVDETFLKGKMKSGNQAEKKAAALMLAEKGKIGTPKDFEDALGALDGDGVLEGKMRKSLKEEHLYASFGYDTDQAFTKLRDYTSSEDKIKKAVAENEAMKRIAQKALKDGAITNINDASQLLTHFNRLKTGSKNDFDKEAYFGQMDAMSKAEIFKQKDFFLNSKLKANTKDYIKNNTNNGGTVTNGRFNKAELAKESAKMNDATAQAEAEAILNSI